MNDDTVFARESEPESASVGMPPIGALPTHPLKAKRPGRAMETLLPSRPLRARTNPRKGKAETKAIVSTSGCLSPLPSSPKRARRANDELSPTTAVPDVSSAEREQAILAETPISALPAPDLGTLIPQLREQWSVLRNWVKSQTSLTNQAKAYCRRLAQHHLGGEQKMEKIIAEAEKIYKAALAGKGGHPQADHAMFAMVPQLQAHDAFTAHRRALEKSLAKLAAKTPGAAFVEITRGMGLLSLAGIIGEAGDLAAYPNPAKLWKRMGVGLVGGERQRKCADKDKAIAHGYSPARRSVLWVLGDCLIKARNPEYRPIYEAKKAEYLAREGWTKMHAHLAAKRYIEKRLLRDLWRAWRAASLDMSPRSGLPPSEFPSTRQTP